MIPTGVYVQEHWQTDKTRWVLALLSHFFHASAKSEDDRNARSACMSEATAKSIERAFGYILIGAALGGRVSVCT